MRKNRELERRRAVERYQAGASPSAICASLGRSREWFYKWLRRFASGETDWFRDRSRRPHASPHATSAEIEQAVIAVRRSLVGQDLF